MTINPNIHETRKKVLLEEFQKPYFADIKKFLLEERNRGNTVYPKGSDIFNAFNLTPFTQTQVVILGQDPYHGPGQAHGLCFSVNDGIPKPPSLHNIYKEIVSDIGGEIPTSGNLSHRAKQGILLLNAILTVQKNNAASHSKIGRQNFTDAVIKILSDKKKGLIFLLRGSYAQSKIPLIDSQKHHIMTAPHPSPLSAHRGFFGCRHFSRVNKILEEQGKKTIKRV